MAVVRTASPASKGVSVGAFRSPRKIVPSVVEVTKNAEEPGWRAMPSGKTWSPGMV